MLNMKSAAQMMGLHTPNYQALGNALASMLASAGEKAIGEKHDITNVSVTPSATGFMHGPNGLMSYPGVDPAVFHTVLGSRGILSQLQWTGTNIMNPLYATFTGITEGDDTVKQEACDPAPESGVKKACLVTAAFGWIARATRIIDVTRVGQLRDRADPTDLFVVNPPNVGSILPGGMDGITLGGDQLLNEWANVLSDRAVDAHRDLSRLAYRGTPLNNTNGYEEFAGFQLLINGPVGGPGTGTAYYKDAITGTPCPSLDSNVQDFNFAKIDDNAANIVRWIAYMARYAVTLADRTNMLPVRWVFAMRETLFYELSQRWPCAYYVGGCTVVDSSGQRLNIDAKDQIDLRDQMRTGRFLLIDGMRWDVVFDDAIPELSNTDSADVDSGCFSSDIYLIPMSVRGGTLVTFGQYFEFQNPAVQSMFGANFLGRVSGAWLETPRQTNNCFQLEMQARPRIVLRTPWLAARLMNVQYCPLQHDRSPFPDDPYYINGGVQGQRANLAANYYNVWDN